MLNLSIKLHNSSINKKYTTTLSAKERLIKYFENRSENGVYRLNTTYTEISKYLNISSRHLRRIISDLVNDNEIEFNSKKEITIL